MDHRVISKQRLKQEAVNEGANWTKLVQESVQQQCLYGESNEYQTLNNSREYDDIKKGN